MYLTDNTDLYEWIQILLKIIYKGLFHLKMIVISLMPQVCTDLKNFISRNLCYPCNL